MHFRENKTTTKSPECENIYEVENCALMDDKNAGVRHVIHLLHVGQLRQVRATFAQHQRVQRILRALLPFGSHGGVQQQNGSVHASLVHRCVVLQLHLVLGQCSGLVRAQHVHACIYNARVRASEIIRCNWNRQINHHHLFANVCVTKIRDSTQH